MSRILVGVDGSTQSARALDYALGLARRLSAALVVVHVRRTFVTYDGLGPQGLVDEGALGADFRAEIERLSADCSVAMTYVDVSGQAVAQVLARTAEEQQADAVVVGASANPLHRWAGSIGAALVKHCRCPVTVVP